MIYFLYQITNQLNGKIYVGVHKTKKLNDSYMGSGKLIKHAIRKYGRANFKRDIIEVFETEAEMYARERELVDNEFIERDDTYNVILGGGGGHGFDHFRSTFNTREEYIAHQRSISPFCNDDTLREVLKKSREVCLKTNSISKLREWQQNNKDMVSEMARSAGALAHTELAAAKRAATFSANKHQQGRNNSQYGSCWICNDGLRQSRKIPKEDIDNWILLGWSKGRKMYK